jgi:hypothetical protein
MQAAAAPRDPGPLAISVKPIQYYSIRHQAGVYLLQEDWKNVYVVIESTDPKNPIWGWVARCYVPTTEPVVIVRDPTRVFGSKYRIRTSVVRVVAIEMKRLEAYSIALNPNEQEDALDGQAINMGTFGSPYGLMCPFSLHHKVDLCEQNLDGEGVYIYPSQTEAYKALAAIKREIKQ